MARFHAHAFYRWERAVIRLEAQQDWRAYCAVAAAQGNEAALVGLVRGVFGADAAETLDIKLQQARARAERG